MATARFTHGTRDTLPLYQRQQNEDQLEAVANIAPELATEREPLVHTETRERTFTIRGRVSGAGRARDDSTTDDWRQALANYIDLLESHVDEFQGDGYTFEDDILDVSAQAVIESVSWSFDRGALDDFEYEITATVGQGTLGAKPIDRRNPTINENMDVLLRIDGIDLPGFRSYQSEVSVGTDAAAIFDRDTAQNNDVVMDEGTTQTIEFEGTHTGSQEDRQAAADGLRNLVATSNNVTLETAYPGYSVDGFLTSYNDTQESRFGTDKHHYNLAFTIGQKA